MSKKPAAPPLTEDTIKAIFPMILRIVQQRRQQSQVVDHEDLVAEGLLALVRSNTRFDPSRKVKLSTFAYRNIDGAVRDLQERQENHQKRVLTVDSTDLEGVAEDPALEKHSISRQLYGRMLNALEAALPEEQALIIVRHYFEQMSFVEIAREFQVPVAHIEMFHRQALTRLRDVITADTGGDN